MTSQLVNLLKHKRRSIELSSENCNRYSVTVCEWGSHSDISEGNISGKEY